MPCYEAQDFKTYCLQIITASTVFQIDLRADFGNHSISEIFDRCENCYYDRYLPVFQDSMAALDISYTHLSYKEYPADTESAWNFTRELAYPADNAISTYMESVGNPDELYMLINIKKDGDKDSSDNRILALKAVKNSDISVKSIYQSSYMYYGDEPRNDKHTNFFEIAAYTSSDENRNELASEWTMAVTPFNDRLIRLLSNIDTLNAARQVTNILGYNE